jgi:hypothetical protein
MTLEILSLQRTNRDDPLHHELRRRSSAYVLLETPLPTSTLT